MASSHECCTDGLAGLSSSVAGTGQASIMRRRHSSPEWMAASSSHACVSVSTNIIGCTVQHRRGMANPERAEGDTTRKASLLRDKTVITCAVSRTQQDTLRAGKGEGEWQGLHDDKGGSKNYLAGVGLQKRWFQQTNVRA